MAPKSNQRSWSDIQTAIATVSIVTTLGLWNLFATPVQKTKTVQPLPPTDQPPIDVSPTPLPYIKIMFATPMAAQSANTQPKTTKKNKSKNNGGGGTSSNTATVTTTKTS